MASSGCSDTLPISSPTIEPEETAVERALPSPAVTTDQVVTPAEAGATRTAPTPSSPTPIAISPVNTPTTTPEPAETTTALPSTGGVIPLSTSAILPITTTQVNSTIQPPTPTEVRATGAITSETSLDFQITEAQLETNAVGEAQLSLPLNLRRESLQPTVQEIVYLTFANDVAENLTETTFWRANVLNVNNPQQIYSVQHLPFSGPNNPVISPDGKYLVYGLEFNDRTHSMHVALLDIDNGIQEIVDDIITNDGAAPRANSQAFIWATNSQSFIYIKDFADETSSSSEIHQYSL
ncbi:MAG: hypothetical protein SVR94_19080, partial [Pseudomonadota bacterium]|nr:hypothetical protein [Pseudomonadota bacterium]